MSFLAILIALLIDQVLWNADPNRQHNWFRKYCENSCSKLSFGVLNGYLKTAIILLPPVLLVAWLQILFEDSLAGILEVALGAAILLAAMGPRELGRNIDEFLKARDQDESEEINALAMEICDDNVPEQEPLCSLSVARCIMSDANSRLLAPIFWFLVLGPAGAVLYRLSQILTAWCSSGSEERKSMLSVARQLVFILDWIPARLTAIGYAITGNFEGVAQVWKNFHTIEADEQKDEARLLLQLAGPAALDTYPTTEEIKHLLDIPPVIEDAQALVWRTLSLWVIVIGLGSLIVAIS